LRRATLVSVLACTVAVPVPRSVSAATPPVSDATPPGETPADETTPPEGEATPPASATTAPTTTTASSATSREVVARASLEIDTTAAGPAGPIIHSRLDELGNRQLRRAEVLPGRGAQDPWIKITVRAVAGDEPGFIISSALYADGKPIAESAHEGECRLCTEGEAVERATAEVERLVPFVRELAVARQKAAEDAARPPPPPPPEVPEVKPLGAPGKAGIFLLALGGVGVGVGTGLALLEPRPDPDMPLNVINTRPAGFAAIGVGAALVVTGAVLLALDRRPQKRKTALAPVFGPAGAGLVLSGRF
jgi:hypothetical protein